MRIVVAKTGETLEVATGKRGNKEDQRRGNELICRVVKPRNQRRPNPQNLPKRRPA